uniref:DUF371 domain-containing protein n=1 Tax=Geoglobus ahangari TaxID=113653 RepID=A0A7C3YDM7_9EURY
MREEIIAHGHENITAKHRTTLQVTKDKEITLRGDCIIGVSADKSLRDLDPKFKEKLKTGKEVRVSLILPDYGWKIEFKAFGSPKLILNHETDTVIRKSDFICGKTLLIRSEKSAIDLDREFVNLLKDRKTTIILRLQI